MKKLLSLVIIVVGIVADQNFKNWIVANIQLGDTEKIWPNVLSLTYIKNDGAAWSSFSGQQWFFLVLTPIVLVVALWFLWKKMAQNWYFIGLTLIIAGALGNFIDRIRQGFVVDMFQTEFINFPIFNIADILLSVGFVLLFIAILTDKETK
ncbi:lipoprotein signal peptidase [Lactococcus lactis]|uniref:Lipoprotein signal peptidase n=1 Tax=Lactococcus lactis subsp. lactis TaxID=1360 RepID=A0A0V8E2E0_LACLL|nr:signal peptidase II [Lactococcus lactis]AUS69455.1 lipoprotein signal peptidase [Lactococcus lactis subsp. lactis]KGF76692.1 Lipoprotein signal peptidase [Lactococcus lactis]KSU19800.1 Lipoprotein signal peptidase [Lactococcus lactis subsp. lactis]MBK5075332.1 lipoprotein signal peptidase [Lactococcus lactis]MCL9639007.1 signal peptidase II [Lactococcus lactis]